MSTRSIVAFHMDDDSIKGVGVHYDGMPESMGPELTALLARDGFTAVREAVLAHADWASIEAGDPQDPSSKSDNPLYVAGYGRHFKDDDKPYYFAFTDKALQEWWDAEYLYLIDTTGHVTYADIGVGHDHLKIETLPWKELS